MLVVTCLNQDLNLVVSDHQSPTLTAFLNMRHPFLPYPAPSRQEYLQPSCMRNDTQMYHIWNDLYVARHCIQVAVERLSCRSAALSSFSRPANLDRARADAEPCIQSACATSAAETSYTHNGFTSCYPGIIWCVI